MAELFVGCAGFSGPRAGYWKELNLLEMTETFVGFPKPKQLRAVRKEAGEAACIVVTASQVITHPADDPAFRVPAEGRLEGPCGLFRATEAVQQAWQLTLEAAVATAAQGILLRTPPAFTPTSVHRKALTAFVELVKPALGERFLAWEPTGLWEPEDSAELAAELGLVRAGDPLRDPPTGADLGYFRLRGLVGARKTYSEADLERIVEQHEACSRTFVVFDHTERLRDALRLARLVAQG